MRRTALYILLAALPLTLSAQGPSARAQAPRDVTGFWVSVVSED